MNGIIEQWLETKWRLITDDESIIKAYGATFSSPEGRLVLQHMMDNIYCTVYEGIDLQAAIAHNSRRAVVNEILANIDLAMNPAKHRVKAIIDEGATL